MFLPCNLNKDFNSPWITPICVKIVENSVEVKTLNIKNDSQALINRATIYHDPPPPKTYPPPPKISPPPSITIWKIN